MGSPWEVDGKSLGSRWEVLGKSMGSPWEVDGKSLVGCWQVVDRLLAGFWCGADLALSFNILYCRGMQRYPLVFAFSVDRGTDFGPMGGLWWWSFRGFKPLPMKIFLSVNNWYTILFLFFCDFFEKKFGGFGKWLYFCSRFRPEKGSWKQENIETDERLEIACVGYHI